MANTETEQARLLDLLYSRLEEAMDVAVMGMVFEHLQLIETLCIDAAALARTARLLSAQAQS